jgi:hypothetical protein
MTNIDFNKHYYAFQWAVSKNWKDKNGLYNKIQYKIKILTEEYNLSEQEIVEDLISNYWEKGHYNKYCEEKGSLNNWIAGYVYFYLNHIIRKYAVRSKNNTEQRIDPLDQRNQANIVWLDKDNEEDDPDYQPEFLFDITNPENLLLAKETLDFAKDHFTKPEIDYMEGEIDLADAASMSGVSCEAFRKRLERRKRDFRGAMKLLD